MGRRFTFWILLVICPGCAGVNGGAAAGPARPPVEAPSVRSAAGAERRVIAGQRPYLAKIHRLLLPGWSDVLATAQSQLPAHHPANARHRVAEVALRLSPDGRPVARRIHRSSGAVHFDNSALLVVSWLRDLPPLPASLRGAGEVTLIWSFHRDARGCRPEHARLQHRALPPREALKRALAADAWDVAARIVQQQPRRHDLAAMVLDAALAADDPRARRLAMGQVSSERIRLILDRENASQTWSAGLKILIHRRDLRVLLTMLRRRSGPDTWGRRLAPEPVRAAQVVKILDALLRAGGTPTPEQLAHLVEDRRPEVALAALRLVRDRATLARAWRRWKSNPDVAAPVAARRWNAGAAGAAEQRLLRWQLLRRPATVLKDLVRWPIPELQAELAKIIEDSARSPSVRVQAVEAYTRLRAPVSPLLAALKTKGQDPALQLALVKALGQAKQGQRRISLRLARVAYHAQDALAAEALAALVHLGLERYRSDVLYRASRLKPRHRARVLRELWRYKTFAVSILCRLLQDPNPRLSAAARQSLERIPSTKARQALAASPRVAAPAPTAARGGEGPLQRLVLLVLAPRS